MKKRIYLDYAATTPIDKRVVTAIEPYFDDQFGNTASWHSFGREAKEAVEKSRSAIASRISAKSQEIRFTGSATESNNMALKGVAFANRDRGRHIIVSAVEHESVLNSAAWLASQGFEISYLPVDRYGVTDL